MFVCAGNGEVFPFANSIGVGLVQSAIGLTELILKEKPKFILFIGSAGSYGEFDIFDIVESRSASNIELSFFEGNSYTPLDNLHKTNNNLIKNQTIVNSSNYITTNQVISKRFKEHGIGIENMEFFTVIEVAKRFNIDVGGIFIVTNQTNNNAHQDFLNNHSEAMRRLVAYLKTNNFITTSHVSHETP